MISCTIATICCPGDGANASSGTCRLEHSGRFLTTRHQMQPMMGRCCDSRGCDSAGTPVPQDRLGRRSVRGKHQHRRDERQKHKNPQRLARHSCAICGILALPSSPPAPCGGLVNPQEAAQRTGDARVHAAHVQESRRPNSGRCDREGCGVLLPLHLYLRHRYGA